MPTITNDDLAIYRKSRILPPKAHYLSVAEQHIVFQGEVTSVLQDMETYGLYAVKYDNATGNYADVKSGMTIFVGTSAGLYDVGISRVRYSGATSDTLFIAETSTNNLFIVDGMYITVVRDFRPSLVLPRGKGQRINADYTNAIEMFMDYDLAYSGQNLALPPAINITRTNATQLSPKPAGWVDTGESYRTLTLSVANSVVFDTTISSIAWDVQDGTITVGTSSSQNITATFPVGFRWIGVTLTCANGATSERYFPVWVHDDTYLPITNFTYTRDNTREWREMDFEFFQQDMSETTIPYGATVCYWKEYYNDVTPSTYRDQFLAWATRETTIFRLHDERSTLTLRGLAGWFDEFRAVHQRIYVPNSTEPATWFTMPNITLDKLVWYILKNFTTAPLIGNFWLSNKTDPLKSLDTTGSSIWGQLKYILSGYYGVIGCDSLNGFWLKQHRSYWSIASRPTEPPILQLTNEDWRYEQPPIIEKNYNKRTGYVFGGGAAFIGGENVQYAAAAPGRTPNFGSDTPDAPFQNLPEINAQLELQWLTGQHLAYLNNDLKNVNLELLYPMDAIEPAWGQYLEITAIDSNTDTKLVDTEFMIIEVNNTMAELEGREITTLSLEGVTQGLHGDPMPVIVDTLVPTDSYPPVDIVLPPPVYNPIPPPSGQLPVKLWGLSRLEPIHVARSIAIDYTTMVVTYDDLGNMGITGQGVWGCSDPHNYRRKFILTTTGLWRIENLWTTSPSATLVATNAQIFQNPAAIGHHVMMTHNDKRGWIAVLNGNNVMSVSFNYGSTWTQTTIDNAVPDYSTQPIWDNNLYLCEAKPVGWNSSTDGRIYATHYAGSGGVDICKSTDWGLTWTIANHVNFGQWYRHRIEIPYKRAGGIPNRDDGNLVMYLASDRYIGKSTNGGMTFGATFPKFHVNEHYRTFGGNAGITSFTHDGNIIAYTVQQSGVLPAPNVRGSTDGGITATSLNMVGNYPSAHNINGFATTSGFLVRFVNDTGSIGRVNFTTDRGATNWYDITPPFWNLQGAAYFEGDLSDLVK